MKTKYLKTIILALLIPFFGYAEVANTVVLTTNVHGEIVDVAPTSWTNGNINQFYLDFAHTQKTFNNISLEAGTYRYTLRTIMRNNKPGRVNLDITVKFANGGNVKKVDRQYAPGRTDSGTFTVEDYKSQSGGANAGYGKVKVHIGRAAHNTNVNYKITLTKVGGSSGGSGSSGTMSSGSGNGNSGGSGGSPCNYTSLGSKTGNVIGNTVGTYKSTKKACKNTATVSVVKTSGKARTTILVYAASSRNGNYVLKGSKEFPNGKKKSTKTVSVSGVNGKFIKVEVKNRSAANTFGYRLNIRQ